MSGKKPRDPARFGEAEGGAGGGGQARRGQDGAVLRDRDQAAVEGGVEMRGEKQAVEDVEAIRVGVAFGPGAGMAGAEQFRDVEAGDRLDGDGAWITPIEEFDRSDVTFVSVTQSFNTTTSMGRLTLDILLSFAQFEREVIGERIRDKFAALRKRGLWMGGTVPLGYAVKDRKLIVV